MAVIAEALVFRRVPSQGSSTKSKNSTKQAIRDALDIKDIPVVMPYDGAVRLYVSIFQNERTEGDIDNKLKVIQDSMNEIVYVDDKQIDEINIKRVIRSETQTIRPISGLELTAFASDDPALYISVSEN